MRTSSAIAVALAVVLFLTGPAPLHAQTTYGDYPANHVFDRPIYIYHVTARFSASGERTYADYYIHLPWKPAGDRLIIYGAEHSCQLLGGPFQTPAEATAVLPPGAVAWRPGRRGDQPGTSLAAAPPSPSPILLPQARPEDPYNLREEFPPPAKIQRGTTLGAWMQTFHDENKWLGPVTVWLTIGIAVAVLGSGKVDIRFKPDVVCVHCGQQNSNVRLKCTNCGQNPKRK